MRKPRIDGDGPSAVQRLKDLPWEEIEFLLGQRSELSAAKLAAQISSRHGIGPISPQRLSDFWRWAESQQALRQMNADAEQFRAEFAKEHPGASLEEAHEATLAYLHLKAAREDDTKLAKFVLIELRKARVIAHEREKFEFDAAKAALKCLPQLKAIAADKSLDETTRLDAARKHLFGVTPK